MTFPSIVTNQFSTIAAPTPLLITAGGLDGMAETITTGMENLMEMKMVVLVMLITAVKGESS